MTEKTCNSCIHFGACSKWTDFPKQCGVPVCARFAQQSEWISVEDGLPTPHEKVLVIDKNGNVDIDFMLITTRTFVCNKEYTHWMPLPQPPKGGE